MVSDAAAVGDGGRDEIFPQFNRVRQFVAERQRGANRGGIRAAGAVGGNALDEGCRQEQFGFAVEENINRFAGIFQVAAFDQHRAAVAGMNGPRGGSQIFRRGNFLAGENFRLVQIRRDQRGERHQFFLQDFFRRRLQQP